MQSSYKVLLGCLVFFVEFPILHVEIIRPWMIFPFSSSFFFFSIFIILEKIGLSSGREIACRLPWSSWKWISGVFRAGLFLLCTSGNNFYMQGMGLMGLTRNTGVFNKVLPFKPWALTSVNQKLSEIVKIFAQIFRLQELLSTCFICFFFSAFCLLH